MEIETRIQEKKDILISRGSDIEVLDKLLRQVVLGNPESSLESCESVLDQMISSNRGNPIIRIKIDDSEDNLQIIKPGQWPRWELS